jgi:hypothetical protein
MAVLNQNETRADLLEVAEAGIHLPQSTDTSLGASHGGDDHDHEHGFELVEVLRVVFVALAAIAVWFHLWEPFHRVSVIGLAATLIGGYPIFKGAFENILERRMTMERHPARQQNPCRWPGSQRPFVCRAGRDHRRTDAKRENDGKRCLRGHDQSGRYASSPRRTSWERDNLRQDH